MIFFRKITVGQLNLSSLWLAFMRFDVGNIAELKGILRHHLAGKFTVFFFFEGPWLGVDIFIGQAVFIDDVVNVGAEFALFALYYHVFQLVDQNGDLYLDYLWDLHDDLAILAAFLAEVLTITEFRLGNQALVVT